MDQLTQTMLSGDWPVPVPTSRDEAQASTVRSHLSGLGQRVRHFRSVRHWRQRELSAKSGLSERYIGRIERGEASPTYKTIVRLALALQVDVGDLVTS